MYNDFTQVLPDRILLKGYDLCELASSVSFGDVVYLLAKGVMPTGQEGRMIEAILICCSEHGSNAPSTFIARATASCGVPIQAAIASGVNSIGNYHGGAGETLAEIMQKFVLKNPHLSIEELANDLIGYFLSQGMRVPGFGHRQHNPDPRAKTLIELGRRWNICGRYTNLVEKISEILRTTRAENLHINVDGALAALISDMGLHWSYAKSLFILSRVAGITAHVLEEIENAKPLGFIREIQKDKTP